MTGPRTISSRDNALLLRLRKLAADPAAYRKLGTLWLEGDHLCQAYLQRGGVPAQALVTEQGWAQPGVRALASRAAIVSLLTPALMAGISTLESPPALGYVVPWQEVATPATGTPTVVLDRLQDAGNVGTVLRSAAAFGFAQVIALKGTAALWSPKVLRAGMGAHFALTLVERIDPDDVSLLRGLALPLLAASPHAAQAIDEISLPWPCAWVLGHEGQGVAATLLAQCSLALRIPQPGGEESLNVAAAAAVCLYESARQRRRCA